MVGVDVGVEDVGEGEVELVDELEVAVHLLDHGVDQHGLARGGIADEVGVRRGLGIEELAENHHAGESHEPAQTIHRPAHKMQASRPWELFAGRLVSVPPVSAHTFLHRALASLPALRRVGRRLTGDSAEADDLVQDTLMRALERRDELRDPERLQGWLLAVQRTVFLNSRRGLRPRLEVLEGGLGREPLPEPAGDLEAELHGQTLGPELQAALDALAPEWRDALWLREVEDLSYEEIAAIQGCPVGTVRSRLARARAAMGASLTKEKSDASV